VPSPRVTGMTSSSQSAGADRTLRRQLQIIPPSDEPCRGDSWCRAGARHHDGLATPSAWAVTMSRITLNSPTAIS
jgi:hypothetical protein